MMNNFYLVDIHCYVWTTSPAALLVIVTYISRVSKKKFIYVLFRFIEEWAKRPVA